MTCWRSTSSDFCRQMCGNTRGSPSASDKTPFVVVRRGPISSHEIPVGIRGTYRNERCAGTCHPSLVREILTPQKLLGRAAAATYPSRRASDIPALQALALLTERWSTLEFPWGPGGSVGFEKLATGRPTATSRSDLDAVIYADRPMTTAEARRLRDDARGAPRAGRHPRGDTDLRLSLVEYANRSPAPHSLAHPIGYIPRYGPWLK